MPGGTNSKRQNFNVKADQEAKILPLQSAFTAVSAKDAILRAVRLSLVLTREIKSDKRIGLIDSRLGVVTEVTFSELESVGSSGWTYLV